MNRTHEQAYRSRPGGLAALASCLALATVAALRRDLTGRWAASGPTLDNGEVQKAILELKQDGDKLKGTCKRLAYSTSDRHGNRRHFELWGVDWNDTKPFLIGDMR